MTDVPAAGFDPVTIGLVSVSDRASSGVYADQGIPALQDWLSRALKNPVTWVTRLIPDEQEGISATLRELVDDAHCDLVLTTGGTGPAPRDVTPEATLAVAHKEMPGFGEQMRQISLRFVPTAILSRQVAVIRGQTLIINLPGQPKAIAETLQGLPDASPPAHGIFAAVPYCVDLIGGPTSRRKRRSARPSGRNRRCARRARRLPDRPAAARQRTSWFSAAASKSRGLRVARDAVAGGAAPRQRLDCRPQHGDLVFVARGVVDQAFHRLRHRVVSLAHAVGRETHLRRRRLALHINRVVQNARRVADRRGARRHRLDYHRARADPRPVADQETAEHLRVGSDDHALAQRRVPFGALVERGAAERHALVDGAVVTDLAVSPITTPMPWSMKTRRPIVAPGWISMPVRKRPRCDRKRPSQCQPRVQQPCASRCTASACSPG
ncbi:Molybdopterin adenylyltransferase [Methylibium sp. T29]|nr:Molybdopterin adenylyltransferase [Methylibium sp. T29]